jgi:hypothetical protein
MPGHWLFTACREIVDRIPLSPPAFLTRDGVIRMKANDTTVEWSIGETAGRIWHCLEANGSLSYAQLVKQVDQPRDLVMQALGWLAREEKVLIESNGKRRFVTLK